jgi:hypothetical protein
MWCRRMNKGKELKLLVSILTVIIIIPYLSPLLISPFPVLLVKAEGVSEEADRSKLIMLVTIALALSDMPLDQIEKYELFHTLYIYRNGSVQLINQPYLPGELVLNITKTAIDIKKNTNISIVTSEGRVDMYINGSLAYAIEYGENVSSWSLWLGELYNKTVDNNTIIYWRWVRANYTNEFIDYNVIYLIRNVSNTHRVYIATAAELKPDNSSYSYVFTFANYYFMNKTTFYGDWIILPEGANSLSEYYKSIAYGVKWLSENVYNGTSPGYFVRGKDSRYVPQAHPQIASALKTLASNIPTEIDLPVEKGYALATDSIVWPMVCIAISVIGFVLLWYGWENKILAYTATVLMYIGGICVGHYIPEYKRWLIAFINWIKA